MKKILVTRPHADFNRTAEKLLQMGYDALHAPMMDFRELVFETPKTADISALIFTSTNGIRAIKDYKNLRELPCYAVGAQTKQLALECGFDVWATGAGDVASLCQIIDTDCKIRKVEKPLLHISGAHQAGNLCLQLNNLGIICQRLQAYIMDEINFLPPNIVDEIKDKNLAGILFYSQRSAKIFLDNADKLGLMLTIVKIPTFCLSKTIAQRVCTPYLKHIYYSEQANEDILLKLVQDKVQ